jgi:hypothetical protein
VLKGTNSLLFCGTKEIHRTTIRIPDYGPFLSHDHLHLSGIECPQWINRPMPPFQSVTLLIVMMLTALSALNRPIPCRAKLSTA